MLKRKVAGISCAVLKWLIPAQMGRYCESRTSRNLDLPPYAGYRAREMPARTTPTYSGHDLGLLTKSGQCEYSTWHFCPPSVHFAGRFRDFLMAMSLADWTKS